MFLINKINSLKPVPENTEIIIDYKTPSKSDVTNSASYKGKSLFYKNVQLVILFSKTGQARP